MIYSPTALIAEASKREIYGRSDTASAVAFCGVVILTIFAAEDFDPRLTWDAAARNSHRSLQLWRGRS